MRLKPKRGTKYNKKERKRYDTDELNEAKIKVRYRHWSGGEDEGAGLYSGI